MKKKPSSWTDDRKDDLRRLDIGIKVPIGKEFDPSSAADCRVLQVSTEMADHQLGTDDDTEYVVRVENASEYYLALNIRVRVSLPPEVMAADTTPDGTVLLELIPDEQYIECLPPRASKALRYRAIARGVEEGCYKIDVELDYSIVYWDGRPAAQRRTFLLPVGVPAKGYIRAGTRPLPTISEIYQGKKNEDE
jgi:hypothetical protein